MITPYHINSWPLPLLLLNHQSLYLYKLPCDHPLYVASIELWNDHDGAEALLLGQEHVVLQQQQTQKVSRCCLDHAAAAAAGVTDWIGRKEVSKVVRMGGGEVDYVDAQYQKKEYACSWFKYITLHKSFCNFKVMNFHGWCKKIHMQICKLIMRRPHLQGPGSRSNL